MTPHEELFEKKKLSNDESALHHGKSLGRASGKCKLLQKEKFYVLFSIQRVCDPWTETEGRLHRRGA